MPKTDMITIWFNEEKKVITEREEVKFWNDLLYKILYNCVEKKLLLSTSFVDQSLIKKTTCCTTSTTYSYYKILHFVPLMLYWSITLSSIWHDKIIIYTHEWL